MCIRVRLATGLRGSRIGVWSLGAVLSVVMGSAVPLRAEAPIDATDERDEPYVVEGEFVSTGVIERGEFLVRVTDCGACHTPMNPATGTPDMTRRLSGHPAEVVMSAPPRAVGRWSVFFSDTNTAYAGPWGISYATNLTPDVETGIGGWGEQLFVDTMKSGRHLGGEGRPFLPPMPGEAYRYLPEEDLRAMYAYLMTLPAIQNPVPEATPPAPAQ